MTLSTVPAQQADLVIDAFAGRSLKDILQVVVSLGDEKTALLGTAIFVFEDGIIQVFVDVHEKGVLTLESLSDVVVVGDYSERTGVSLRSLGGPQFVIQNLFVVWERVQDQGAEWLVGMFLADKHGTFRLGLNLHLDDLIVGPPRELWQYIGAAWSPSDTMRVEIAVPQSRLT